MRFVGGLRFSTELFESISICVSNPEAMFTHTRSAILILESLRRGVRFGSVNNGGHGAVRMREAKW
jgi:hypothetical protein